MGSSVRLVGALLALVAALSGPTSAGCPPAAPARWGVGVRTLDDVVDDSRPTPAHETFAALPYRKLVTEVWYPTAGDGDEPVRDAPAARGRFPLIVNSPGYNDLRIGAGYLATALAARGYVVASLDFPLTGGATMGGPELPDVVNQPADVRFVVDTLLARSRAKGSWLRHRVDAKRIGLQGLSLGGFTTLLAAYHPVLRDRRVKAAVALAPYSCPLGPALFTGKAPLLLLAGDQDLITPIDVNAARTFANASARRTLVTLADASHTAFTGLVSFPSQTSYDATLGCPVVEAGITQEDFDATVAAFGALADGADLTGCTLACLGAPPANPPMQAVRQHEITVAAVTAFFDATLKRARAGRCFLGRELDAANDDVRVEATGGAR